MGAILEGRRVAPGIAGGGKSEHHRARCRVTGRRFTPRRVRAHAGRQAARPPDGECHREQTANRREPAARVKRWGKSPPRRAQARRQGKPHRVQGQIGGLWGGPPRGCKTARLRVRSQQMNDPLRAARRADRIRLTALPKSLPQRVANTAGAPGVLARFTARSATASGAWPSPRSECS